MTKIAIVTDSTSDIPVEILKKLNISVVPLTVLFDKESYKADGIELSIKDFYMKLKNSKVLPKTIQPSPGDFIKTYKELFEKYDEIISIHISKKMSGTVDSAIIAKKEFKDKKIEIIDSELVHMPLGFLVMEAAYMAGKGFESKSIIERINLLKPQIKSLFVPKTLEYLQKGGRIGRAKSLIASLLEIKPILTINLGEVSPYKNTRRWNQAKDEIVSSMKIILPEPKNLIVSVGDLDLKEDGEEMAQKIKDKLNPSELIRVDFGAIVGAHLGPGIGITFYDRPILK
ncbi:MAG: DegV family protein [Actinomycetota bacterium]|nr:DegV family protein [Actinomycetota bacterium]